MARGIHLKELKSVDLEAIGVPDDGLPAEDGNAGRAAGLLAEADPVLSQTLVAVKRDLEKTLQILNEALSAGTSTQAQPQMSEKPGS